MMGIRNDHIIVENVLSFLIWKISKVYDIAQRPPGKENTITFSKNVTGDVNGVNMTICGGGHILNSQFHQYVYNF